MDNENLEDAQEHLGKVKDHLAKVPNGPLSKPRDEMSNLDKAKLSSFPMSGEHPKPKSMKGRALWHLENAMIELVKARTCESAAGMHTSAIEFSGTAAIMALEQLARHYKDGG